jgi:hypothetical protein
MSPYLPTTPGAFQVKRVSLGTNGFVVKFSPQGRVLYSTYLGGTPVPGLVSSTTYPWGIQADAAGDAYVVGFTRGANFPLVNPTQAHHANPVDRYAAFVSVLNPAGSALVFSTYLGGSLDNYAYADALGPDGTLFVAGNTSSLDFPTTPNASQTQPGAGVNVSRISGFLTRYDGFTAHVAFDLHPVAYDVKATEAAPFQTLIASFSDARPTATASQFTATIDWGDGTTSPGTIAADTAQSGQFLVVASHTYVHAGDLPLSVSITSSDPADNAASATSTAHVEDAPLSAVGDPVSALEGTLFQGVVATVYTTTPTDTSSDLTASIDWGDGTTAPGTLAAHGSLSGPFDVTGAHIYRDAGAYAVRVTVSDNDGTAKAIALAPFSSAPAGSPMPERIQIDTSALRGQHGFIALQFNPGAIPGSLGAKAVVSNIEGVTFDAASTHGDVTIANIHIFNQVRQAIDFGGSLSFDVAFQGPWTTQGPNRAFASAFAVQLLASDGLHPLLTTDPGGAVLTIEVGPDGRTTTRAFAPPPGATNGPAARSPNVVDAPLLLLPGAIQAGPGQTFQGRVASLSDANPLGSAADFRALIVWGDGQSSPGIVQTDKQGGFDVLGMHRYAAAGTYAAHVQIDDNDGSTAVAAVRATIGGVMPPPSGDGPTVLAVHRFGIHHQPTVLVVDFSGPLDPTHAQDVQSYEVFAEGSDSASALRNNVQVPILSASYDPATHAVTLVLQQRMNFHHPFRFVVKGTGPHAIVDPAGHNLDGSSNGHPGSDYATLVTEKNLVFPVAPRRFGNARES